MSTPLQPAFDQRRDQLFLKFDAAEVERMRGFGDVYWPENGDVVRPQGFLDRPETGPTTST
jgi:hypothetical protein